MLILNFLLFFLTRPTGWSSFVCMNITKTQEKLLQAAMPLMLSKGYPATTVDEICEKAGVSKGSFYHAFPSKEELGLVLLEWYHQGGKERIFEGPFNEVKDPRKKMLAFVDHMDKLAKELWGNGCLLANMGLELAETNPRIRARVSKLFKKLVGRLEIIFEPAACGNGNKSHANAKDLAEQFVVMLEGSIVLARVNKDWNIVSRGFQNFKSYLKTLSN